MILTRRHPCAETRRLLHAMYFLEQATTLALALLVLCSLLAGVLIKVVCQRCDDRAWKLVLPWHDFLVLRVFKYETLVREVKVERFYISDLFSRPLAC